MFHTIWAFYPNLYAWAVIAILMFAVGSLLFFGADRIRNIAKIIPEILGMVFIIYGSIGFVYAELMYLRQLLYKF